MKKDEVKILQVRMSIDDYRKLESDAMLSGFKISEYVRQIIFSNKGVALKEEEAAKYLNKAIAEMDLLTFVSMRSFLKKVNKKKGKGRELTINTQRE